MLSRKKIENMVYCCFDFDALPLDIQDPAKEFASTVPLEILDKLSDKIKFVLKSNFFHSIERLPDIQKCLFLKCSQSLYSKIKNGDKSFNIKQGRPTKLLSEGEQKIRQWLEERAEKCEFPTKKEFKQRCVYFLEQQKFDGSFSKNYFDELIKRIAPDFEVRRIQAVDFERGFLKKKEIEEYFQVLRNLEIEQILPKLIINLDETGFGGSKSGRMKSKKVIVTKGYKGKIHYQYDESSYHISALIAITASGNLLPPSAIIKRGSQHPDGSTCPYFNKMQVYSTPSAFMTRNVFENYFQNTILNYIQKVRNEIGNEDEPALVIYDGLKSHLSDVIFAKCAEANVRVVTIPSHSSHILQPLDQGVFRSMKNNYSSVPKWPGKSQITTKLQKIFTAIEETDNHQIILRSWSHCGILPILEEGDVQSVMLVENSVLMNETLIFDETDGINEKSRGKKTEKAPSGLMNEKELDRVKNGCCPLCGTKLPQDDQ